MIGQLGTVGGSFVLIIHEVADYPAWATASRWSSATPRDAGHVNATG